MTAEEAAAVMAAVTRGGGDPGSGGVDQPTPGCENGCVDQNGNTYQPTGSGGITDGDSTSVSVNGGDPNGISFGFLGYGPAYNGTFSGLFPYHGFAPSSGTPWYKNPCITSALAKGAGSTAIDAIGLLPEGGAVAGAFSLWHGAAAVSNGGKILERVQFGAAIISTANAGSDVQGSEGAYSLSGAQLATGAAAIGAGLLKAAPIVGQALSAASVLEDLYGTYKAVAGCHP